MTLKIKTYESYGALLRSILAPAFAPLFKELYDQQRRIVRNMMDSNHYYVDDDGVVREKKIVNEDEEYEEV